GGLVFAALAAAAGLVMITEWAAMHRQPALGRRLGLAVLAGAAILTHFGDWASALLLLGGAAGLGGLFLGRLGGGVQAKGARLDRGFVLGLLYCALPVVALIWLRAQPWGLYATLFVMAVVWGADIAAYFTGRALGGPKLAPAISPNKTWSGALGGLAGSLIAASLVALIWPGYANAAGLLRLAGLAVPLAVLSILGDLYESGLKRRAGVKDSGSLLPGHGGVMDRLDGLVPAAVAGAGVFAATGWAG
ncbi:phosphatidate cytidylyltransferase, partial [Sandarakinorhabdus rubra]|uniref:phosphatidate cytidylyltransferase n=1 Tax=Sandarakinorhabdus rubra TaxID=2672568 RepID=UPI0013DBB283